MIGSRPYQVPSYVHVGAGVAPANPPINRATAPLPIQDKIAQYLFPCAGYGPPSILFSTPIGLLIGGAVGIFLKRWSPLPIGIAAGFAYGVYYDRRLCRVEERSSGDSTGMVPPVAPGKG